MRASKIIGMGYYVPDKVVTNDDLAKLMDTSHEWIVERTGIHERRYVDGNVGASELAIEASKNALDDAGLKPADLDMIIFATLSPDYCFPGSGVLVQDKLGCSTIPAIDIRNQCSGFPYSLSIADQYIKTGWCDNILVIGAEVHSTGLDFSDQGRSVTVIFGDGAGAALVGPSDDPEKGILSTHMHSEGEGFKKLWTPAPMSCHNPRLTPEMLERDIFPIMDGKGVFRNAIPRFCEVIIEALEKNNKSVEDLDMFIPHQANDRITWMVAKKMGLPEDKVFSNIAKFGNCTAGSIPIALCDARDQGKVKPGDLVILASFGAGFTWASALIQM